MAQAYEHCLRARRRLLTTAPLQAMRARRLAAHRREVVCASAAPTDPAGDILAELDAGAVCTRSQAEFAALLGPHLGEVLAELRGRLADDALWSGGAFIESDMLLDLDARIYRLGLAPRLLELAEAYVGLPCWYLGALLKRELPDGGASGPRQWHRDIEDSRMLRVLVYLSDVETGDGPFEYLPAQASDAAARKLAYRLGYLPDAALMAASPAAPQEAQGAAGQAIFFDGARLFHRAQPPRRRARYSLTLTYVSRWPLQLNPTARLTRVARRRVLRDLDRRERGWIPPARRLPLAPR